MKVRWVWWGLGLLLLTGGGAAVYGKTRGLRNRNPGNIRHGGSQWQGASAVQTDADFVQFSDSKWGVRALARVLLNYQSRHNLRTVREIIGRWAPPVENDTGSYVQAVARRLAVSPDAVIDLGDHNLLTALAAAIIRHENGVQPFAVADLSEWVALA